MDNAERKMGKNWMSKGSASQRLRKPNRSHAVMAQRHEPKTSADDFPTQPWATRGYTKHILGPLFDLASMTVLEPAAHAGNMSRPLAEAFGSVTSFDKYDYGFAPCGDFLEDPFATRSYDFVITNPPFNLAEQFIVEGLRVARVGVGMFVRASLYEGVGRYTRLFRDIPPSIFSPFVERVPLYKGRLVRRGTTATWYAWFTWLKGHEGATVVQQIPPCRRELERDSDYEPCTS